ncbi:MAG: MlaE family lipid ABC transporter permease subunit [Chitinispirillia bacterium]|jgi:phospholipid/cholesterol/gamma-HCH transport system permease protein
MTTRNRTGSLVNIPEKLTKEWIESSKLLSVKPHENLTLDFTHTKTIDSAGISLIYLLNNSFKTAGKKLILKNISDRLLIILKKWVSPPESGIRQKEENFLVKLGEMLLHFIDEVIQALSILVEMIYWGTFGLLKKRDFRRGVLGEQMYQLGFNAIGIVCLLSFIMGLVISVQSALQLKMYGADVFISMFITWSMVREFGPFLTAIILAGRTGSATTAEIATMCVQEEVDAIKTMGLNHIQFIVIPKFWAISLTMPLLTMISIITGIFGGFLVSTFYLELTPAIFYNEMIKNIIIKDFIISLIKSVVFAWLIIWIGAYHGFKVKGSAEDVGKETTASVVTAMFVIIIADAVFSFIYNINF